MKKSVSSEFDPEQRVERLIREAEKLPLYQTLWQQEREHATLPVLRPEALVIQIDRRRSAQTRGMWFTVERDAVRVPFVRSTDDLAADKSITIGPRPLIFFSQSDQCLLWSLYAYAHGSVPLIREKPVALTKKLAEQYYITDILTDCSGYEECKRLGIALGVHVTILDSNPAALFALHPEKNCTRLLALEETGVLGVVRDTGDIEYCPDVIVSTEPTFDVTLLRNFAEPLVRYAPGIF